MKRKIIIFTDGSQYTFEQDVVLTYFPKSKYDILPMGCVIDMNYFMGSWDDKLDMMHNWIECYSPDWVIGIGNISTLLEPIRGYKKILICPRFDLAWIKKQLELKEKHFVSGNDELALDWKEMFELDDIRVPLEMIEVFHNEVRPVLFQDITDYDRQNTYGLFESHILGRADRDVFVQHYPNLMLVPPGSTQNFGRIADVILNIIENR